VAHGSWGGRLPLVNYIASQAFFMAARWRMFSKRVHNRQRRSVVVLDNGAEARTELRRFLDAGYDKLNVGGGPKNLSGFVNIDFARFPQVERQVVANILDLSFIESERVAQVHSNHVLEHLSRAEIESQLREYHRILKPEGVLSIRCPNALGVAYGFWFEPVLESDSDEFIRLGFPSDESLADPADKWAHRDLYATLHWFYGDPGNIENQHLTLVTPTLIRKLLADAGFEIIKSAEPEALNIVVVARKTLAD